MTEEPKPPSDDAPLTVDEALQYAAEFADISRHMVMTCLASEVLRLRAAAEAAHDDDTVSELGPLRSGRPEHLTLEAAERHAERLRELDPSQVRIVGRLLLVMHDEVLRLHAKKAPEPVFDWVATRDMLDMFEAMLAAYDNRRDVAFADWVAMANAVQRVRYSERKL